MRFVIPVVFYEITNVQCVYSSNTTTFIGRIHDGPTALHEDQF